ncbi:MAG: hypothetical protein ABIQ15_04485 [Nocardioides sp.]
MADHDDRHDRDAPSLELPSLSLRRLRRPEAEADTNTEKRTSREQVVSGDPEPDALFTDESADETTPTRGRRTLPRPSGPLAAAATGAVVGLLGVGLTWLLLGFCGLVTGTSSCGNPGMLLLLVAVLALGVLGAAVLRALGVEAPGSTSALGIGLLAVLAILFFGDALFSRWMTLVLPALSLASYTLAHLVTTAATES